MSKRVKPPISLKEKIVIITGASSGFGADSARFFALEGATVVLVARRVDQLKMLAAEIQSTGGTAFVQPVDLAVPSQVEGAVQTILDMFGHIDILVNNAGFGRLNWLEKLDPEADIGASIAVNLRGLILITRQVLPTMYRQRSGHIINISSVAGFIAAPLYSIYSATKYGVRGFTEALRREAAPFGVQVSGIYPGPALTEFSQRSGDNPIKRNLKLPGFIWMSSERVARRIVQLARHPRRTVILPGYYRAAFLINNLFPGMVDWILKVFFVNRYHQ